MVEYRWTNGEDEDFKRFYEITETFYNQIAGGADKRQGYVSHNASADIPDVVLACFNGVAVGCAVLQTRPAMTAAVALYSKRDYVRIENYPPYDKLDGAVCYGKEL